MKTPSNFPNKPETNFLIGTAGTLPTSTRFSSPRFFQPEQQIEQVPGPALGMERLLTKEAMTEIAQGGIPDLSRVCLDLYRTFLKPDTNFSALQFVPILSALQAIDQAAAERFIKNPNTRHVLVNHTFFKAILIHWAPGTFSGVHGHAQGGCVFKVLNGSLEEKRYSPDAEQQFLAVSTFHSGSMAYIDDNMAYHAVGNPNDESAISLHVYTPGRKR